MRDNHCVTTARELAAGHFARAAFPSVCTLADAVLAISALAKEPDFTGILGEHRVQTKWRALHSDVAGSVFRLWHDGTQVIAIEIEDPRPTEGWSGLRDALGPPQTKIAYWDDVVQLEDGQWVYPSRGLALFVRLGDAELARVMFFPPTTIDSYRARLARAIEPPREFREP